MAHSENAVAAKARAAFGRMLTPAQYDELLRKQSVQEISAYLREHTAYAQALEGVQDSAIHRGRLETLLRRDLFYQYVRLTHYAPGGGADTIYGYIVPDMEIELILSALRVIISGGGDLLAALPGFMQNYARIDLVALAQAKTLDELIEAVHGTPYEPILRACREQYPPQGGSLRFTQYEAALRTYYFESMRSRAQHAPKRAARQLSGLIRMRAELMNLNTIFRMKTYFNADTERIRMTMLPYHWRIRPRQMQEMIEAKDTQTFMKLLSQTALGRQIDPQAAFIESETERVRYHETLRTLRFATHPQVVYLAFMLLRAMETEDIIRIIEGVRYRLPPERIGSMLARA